MSGSPFPESNQEPERKGAQGWGRDMTSQDTEEGREAGNEIWWQVKKILFFSSPPLGWISWNFFSLNVIRSTSYYISWHRPVGSDPGSSTGARETWNMFNLLVLLFPHIQGRNKRSTGPWGYWEDENGWCHISAHQLRLFTYVWAAVSFSPKFCKNLCLFIQSPVLSRNKHFTTAPWEFSYTKALIYKPVCPHNLTEGPWVGFILHTP